VTRVPVPKGGRGMALEAALDFAHARYRDRERVLVRRYGVAGRFFGKGKFIPLPKLDQPVDYHGCDRGRLLVFDAKEHRKGDRWRLDARYEHQYQRLVRWSQAGALAFFAVLFGPRDELYLLRIRPASDWPMVDLREPRHHDLLLVLPNDENWFDWLAAVRTGWI